MKLHKDTKWLAAVVVAVFMIGIAYGVSTDCDGTAGQYIYCFKYK